MQNKRFTRTLSYRGVDVDLDVDRRAGRQAEAVSDGVHLKNHWIYRMKWGRQHCLEERTDKFKTIEMHGKGVTVGRSRRRPVKIRTIRRRDKRVHPLPGSNNNKKRETSNFGIFCTTHLAGERRDRLEEGLGVRPAPRPGPAAAALVAVGPRDGGVTAAVVPGRRGRVILPVAVPAPPAGAPPPAGAAGAGRPAPSVGVPRHCLEGGGQPCFICETPRPVCYHDARV